MGVIDCLVFVVGHAFCPTRHCVFDPVFNIGSLYYTSQPYEAEMGMKCISLKKIEKIIFLSIGSHCQSHTLAVKSWWQEIYMWVKIKRITFLKSLTF